MYVTCRLGNSFGLTVAEAPAPQPERRESQEKPNDDSATESESDISLEKGNRAALVRSSRSPLSVPPESGKSPSARPSSRMPSEFVAKVPAVSAPASDSDSSPRRPVKKHKGPESSSADEDSEEERRKHLAQLRSGNGPTAVKRGVRQPIKRGGKRF